MTAEPPPAAEEPAGIKRPPAAAPTDFQKRTLWTALTGLSMVAIGATGVLVIWLFAKVFQFLQPVLVPLAAAGILAYLLEPLIKRLTDRGTPRFRAMVWVFSLFHVLMLFMFLSIIVPTAVHVSRWAGKQNRETLTSGLENTLDQVFGPLEKFASPVKKPAQPAADGAQAPGAAEKPQTGSEQSTATQPPTPAAAAEPDAAAPDTAEPAAPVHQEKWWKEWLRDKDRSSGLMKKLGEFGNAALAGFMGAFGYIVGFLMVPFYLYYFLKDADSIRRNWSQVLPLRASKFKTEVVEVLSQINGYLIAFFRGAMLVSLIDGLLVGLSLTIFGLPWAPLIGLFVALLGLLPYVGHILCWLASMVICILHFGIVENRFSWLPALWAYPVIVTLIFVLVMKINALVTAPRILGNAVGLHPLTVIFSVLFWSLLVGPILGALLAVPLSASVKVLFRRYIWDPSVQRSGEPPAGESNHLPESGKPYAIS